MTDLSTSSCVGDTALRTPEPSDLAVALHVGQRMLARYGDTSDYDVFAYAQAHGGLTEALRIILRAHGIAPEPSELGPPGQADEFLRRARETGGAQ